MELSIFYKKGYIKGSYILNFRLSELFYSFYFCSPLNVL